MSDTCTTIQDESKHRTDDRRKRALTTWRHSELSSISSLLLDLLLLHVLRALCAHSGVPGFAWISSCVVASYNAASCIHASEFALEGLAANTHCGMLCSCSLGSLIVSI